jgi:TRAP-type C4-dicarboxylate transport system permease small subunit
MADGDRSILARLLWLTELVEDALLVLLLATMISLAGAQIVLRNLFDSAIVWADPLLRVGVLWVGMIGAMVATRGDKQISIDAVSKFLPPRTKAGIRVVTDIFTGVVSAVVAWSAYRLMLEDRAAGGLTIGFVPVWICESVIPVAFAVIAIRYLGYAVRHARESAAKVELP